MPPSSPSVHSLLETLPSRGRLTDLARYFSVSVPPQGTRAELAAALARSEQVRLRAVVEWMGRDELRAACLAHGLDASSRARSQLAGHLLQALGAHESAPPAGLFGARVVPPCPDPADGPLLPPTPAASAPPRPIDPAPPPAPLGPGASPVWASEIEVPGPQPAIGIRRTGKARRWSGSNQADIDQT